MPPSPRRPKNPATEFVSAQVRQFLRSLTPAMAGDDEAIHRVRVSGRRLRVLLPLAVPRPRRGRVRKARRRLRDVLRAAGARRDAGVRSALFEAEAKDDHPQTARLRRRLASARRRATGGMADALLDLDLSGLRDGLRKIVLEGGEEPFIVLMRLRRAREEAGIALLAQLEGLGETFDPAALHAARRRVRRLRYLAELGAAHLPAYAEAVDRFKRVQDLLGEVRDAWILAEWFEEQRVRAGRRGDGALAEAARRLARAFRSRSRKLHRDFLAEDPRAVLRSALEQVDRSIPAA